MQKNESPRPYVLSIAGFDPSGGAGLLADIKTMEQFEVYGLAVNTANTVQHGTVFQSVNWLEEELILAQLSLLMKEYTIRYVKIGLIKNWVILSKIIEVLYTKNPQVFIVLDPIFRASTGFDFHGELELETFYNCLSKISLITPNRKELELIGRGNEKASTIACQISKYCAVLYKGGHNENKNFGVDVLYLKNGEKYIFEPKKLSNFEKHGSGCVLSAAITANLAMGHSLEEACRKAKNYITNFLDSNPTMLGYHKL